MFIVSSILSLTSVFLFQYHCCRCTQGWTGTFCQSQDPCYRSPCQNGAVCEVVNTGNLVNFDCHCPLGYIGALCGSQHSDSACITDPCHNGKLDYLAALVRAGNSYTGSV